MSVYLSSIHVQNFKSLIGPTDIEIKPLTFFYGPNSAGKSAISTAIDLLRQFCEAGEPTKFEMLHSLVRNRDINNIFSLGLTASYDSFPYGASLDYDEFASLFNDLEDNFYELFDYFYRTKSKGHASSGLLNIGIRFDVDLNGQPKSSWLPLMLEMAENLISIDFNLCGSEYWVTEVKVDSEVLVIMSWQCIIFNLSHDVFSIIDRRLSSDGLTFSDLVSGFYDTHKVGSFLGIGPEHIFRNGFLDLNSNISIGFNNSIAEPSGSILWNFVRDLIRVLVMIPMHVCASAARSAIHLGPVRHIPAPRELTFLERGYKVYATTETSSPNWHWYNGSAAWKEIVSSLSEDNQLLSTVNSWLTASQRLNLRHGVFITVYNTREITVTDENKEQLAEFIESIPERLIFVRLRDEILDIPVDVKDVGAGVPQIVPVLVAGLSADCSFIEQPELHLHPRLQTEIADFFISVINNQGHRCIIETHSEHLALRTLRRVRETHSAHIRHRDFSLENESVAFYYFNPVEGGTEITRLRVSPEGDFLDRWPRGFFSEREAEIFDDDD